MTRTRLRLSKATASTSDDNGEVREVEGHVGGRVQVRESESEPAGEWTCDIVFAVVRQLHSVRPSHVFMFVAH